MEKDEWIRRYADQVMLKFGSKEKEAITLAIRSHAALTERREQFDSQSPEDWADDEIICFDSDGN